MSDCPFDPAQFSRALLAWYGKFGRSLPWRTTRDPYRIWVSEIMLQQTTVAAVVGYYERFLQRFPTVSILAVAPLEDVIDQWAGLGYYSRARNLHATAQLIASDYDGRFPDQIDQLQQFPGIGRSTAGAIVALAFDRRAPILDANVRRVLCRLFALRQPPRSVAAEKQLWTWAELLTPDLQVHDYTQGMMDLGAMICLPKAPVCDRCPVRELCQAYRLDIQQEIPVKEKKKPVPLRYEVAILLRGSTGFLVRRRPASGLLGGLWEFPTISLTDATEAEKAVRGYLQQTGLVGDLSLVGTSHHVYSHFKLESLVYQVNLKDNVLIAESDSIWKTREELEGLALHGAHKKVYEKVKDK